MRREKKKNTNRIMSIAVVLFYLSVVTTWISSGLYAKYVTTSKGEDSSFVSVWDVSAERDKAALNIDCSKNQLTDECKVTVENNSEVPVMYDITVVLEEALPNKLTLQLDGNNVSANDGRTYHVANAGTLTIGPSQNVHTVRFVAAEDYDGDEYAADFTVKVVASQID